MGSVYLFNMSDQEMTAEVNGFSGDTLAGLGSAPYTPNKSAWSPYTRYKTKEPQEKQFGEENTLHYNVGSGGSGGKVHVGIDIDFGPYPADVDLVVYLFNAAVVVMSPSDSVPYLGRDGETIKVGPGSKQALLPPDGE
ncbi:MAG TPA: hypothetical protein VGI73_06625 [Solirubrobacterales bacterium]|jgi:hypothetical protein